MSWVGGGGGCGGGGGGGKDSTERKGDKEEFVTGMYRFYVELVKQCTVQYMC